MPWRKHTDQDRRSTLNDVYCHVLVHDLPSISYLLHSLTHHVPSHIIFFFFTYTPCLLPPAIDQIPCKFVS